MDNIRVLVLSESYPTNDGKRDMYYVHSRNLYYKEHSVYVDVLNFSIKKEYLIDGIKVFGIEQFEEKYINEKYDILVLHAANLKHHYRFLKKHGSRFLRFVFFFHGHEVLRCSKVYSKPFDYTKQKNVLYKLMEDVYDIFKLKVWNRTFKKYLYKSWFVFVSEWMLNEFKKWIKLDENDLNHQYSIIYNCIGEAFEKGNYDINGSKEYDCISVRGDFDGSKYGVDIICKLAEKNPDKKFCLIGRGEYFIHKKKPNNLIIKQKQISHDEIIKMLNCSRCALMPTRTDAQGVMSCEMATFGIPLITSDIPVCREVFKDFVNVRFIDNDNIDNVNIGELLENLEEGYKDSKIKNYYSENTNGKEVELLLSLSRKIGK